MEPPRKGGDLTHILIRFIGNEVFIMKWKIFTGLLVCLAIAGCSTEYRFKYSGKRYRAEKISYNHPEWDEATIRKVAERRVEIGMTPEMVVAALGKPDSVTIEEEEEKWGYAVSRERGMGDIEKEFVYYVYFNRGTVVRTAGDRSKLSNLTWYN